MRAIQAMVRSTTVSIEELLQHSAWVRELARQLVADAATAEDLVQDAWLAALSRPPQRGVPLRPWLAQVLRNVLRMARRTSARRTARERFSAREEALSSAHEVVELAALQRELVELLLAQDEPYRTTLLLRFFEALPPRAIAARLEVPVETVHTRLRRGLQRLRARLEAQHAGERTTWLTAFLPLARARQALTPSALGWFSMNLKVSLSVCALILLGALAWVRFQPSEAATAADDERSVQLAKHAGQSTSNSPGGAGSARAGSGTRAPVPASSAAAQQPAASAIPVTPLRGRVIDEHGLGLAGIDLKLQSADGTETARTQSGLVGHFEFAGATRTGRVFDDEEQLCTVLCGVATADARERMPIVVVARSIALAGRVVDERGLPLAGAWVRAPEPEGFRTRFHEVLDFSESVHVQTQTDADGFFELPSAPVLSDARLLASFAALEAYDEERPAASDSNLVITLRRPALSDGMLRGIVIDAAGQPVDGACVSLGIALQSTDASGSFAFKLDDPDSINARMGLPVRTLMAAKAGFLPAIFEPSIEAGAAQWPASVTLRLCDPVLSIDGRVLDSNHEPVAGARVFLSEASILGGDERGEVVLENFLAGAEPGLIWRFTQSDAQGRFLVDGLLARDYRLRAMDMNTLLIAQTEPIAAGSTGVVIELDNSQLFPRVAGRLLDRQGHPVLRANVAPMCDAFLLKHLGETLSTCHAASAGTTTDAEGRFELRNVPTSLVYLRIDGEDIVPLEYGRWMEGRAGLVDSVQELPRERIETLEITVGRRVHFQVELADPEFADELAVLDETGQAVELSVFIGNGRAEGPRQPVHGGRSAVIACPDNGVTVVLRKGQSEVARRRLELEPGAVTTVRF